MKLMEYCFREGEEKEFIENQKFIYKNIYGEILKSGPKNFY